MGTADRELERRLKGRMDGDRERERERGGRRQLNPARFSRGCQMEDEPCQRVATARTEVYCTAEALPVEGSTVVRQDRVTALSGPLQEQRDEGSTFLSSCPVLCKSSHHYLYTVQHRQPTLLQKRKETPYKSCTLLEFASGRQSLLSL